MRIERKCRVLVVTDELKAWRIVKRLCKRTQKHLVSILHLLSGTTIMDAVEVEEEDEVVVDVVAEEAATKEEVVKVDINRVVVTIITKTIEVDTSREAEEEAATIRTIDAVAMGIDTRKVMIMEKAGEKITIEEAMEVETITEEVGTITEAVAISKATMAVEEVMVASSMAKERYLEKNPRTKLKWVINKIDIVSRKFQDNM